MKFQWVLEVRDDGAIGSIRSLVSESAYCATTGDNRVSCLQYLLHAFWSLIFSDRVTKLLLGIVSSMSLLRERINTGEK